MNPCIISIDGPAGAGKSTLAKLLADHFDLFFLDTGLLYRAVARSLTDSNLDANDEQMAVSAAETLNQEDLQADNLYGEGIGNTASKVAAHPALRAALLPVQRRLAKSGRGAVVAGRDIGSVVLPDAQFKFFVTASVEQRARRRFEDLQNRGEEPNEQAVLAELIERDRRDAERAVAPLVVPENAVVIDTSQIDVRSAFAQMRQVVEQG